MFPPMGNEIPGGPPPPEIGGGGPTIVINCAAQDCKNNTGGQCGLAEINVTDTGACGKYAPTGREGPPMGPPPPPPAMMGGLG